MTDSPLASSEWSALVGAIRFTRDNTPRLVAADWLQETNRPELIAWAEFIRFQIAATMLARNHCFTDSCDCGVCQPERKAAALFDRWGMHWSMHAFGHADGRREPLLLKHCTSGFPFTIEATLQPFQAHAVPCQVAALFSRIPLITCWINLKGLAPPIAAQFGLEMESFDSWRLNLAFGNTNTPDLFRVQAEITTRPPRREIGHRLVRSSRLVGPRNKLLRAIGGAVRTVVDHRRDCFQGETAA